MEVNLHLKELSKEKNIFLIDAKSMLNARHFKN